MLLVSRPPLIDAEDVVTTTASRDARAASQMPRRRTPVADREDVVETPLDKLGTGVPSEERRGRAARRNARDEEAPAEPSRADNQSGPRRPAVWAQVETLHSPTPVYGAFPVRFVPWALKLLGCERTPAEVLHVCSGALTREDVLGGIRVDIRPDAAPDIIADGRKLPLADASVRAVLIDPPYSLEYARDLYGTDYPRPSHLLAEAARVVRPCGRIGILHFLVPSPPAACSIVTVRGVTQGCGYRIRALTIYERAQDSLAGCT